MSHEYEQFIAAVQALARLSWDEAERAAGATLTTLAERLSSGGARDVAEHLPQELRSRMVTATDAEGFGAVEFVRRVAEREGVDDIEAAALHAHAVFDALQRFVPERELLDMESELPGEFLSLVAPMERARRPPRPEVMPAEEFLRRVADHAATDPGTARRAAEAVLETLGERIAHGEVQDLARYLPPDLRAPLERGDGRSGGKARRMSLDAFVDLVAEREGVGREDAQDHVRAVFVTLRDTVPDQELHDVMAQLPKEFASYSPLP